MTVRLLCQTLEDCITIWQSLTAITIHSSSMWYHNLTIIDSYYYTLFQYVEQQSDSHCQLLLYSLPVCGTTIWQSHILEDCIVIADNDCQIVVPHTGRVYSNSWQWLSDCSIWQSLSAITIQSSSMWHNNLTVIVSYYYTVFQYVAQQSNSYH
jgi:hypothetical protein